MILPLVFLYSLGNLNITLKMRFVKCLPINLLFPLTFTRPALRVQRLEFLAFLRL